MSHKGSTSSSKACDECRRLHRKCDAAEPQCRLCRQNQRPCHRSSAKRIRFRLAAPASAFAAAQPWSAVPPKLDFVDETKLTGRGYQKVDGTANSPSAEWDGDPPHISSIESSTAIERSLHDKKRPAPEIPQLLINLDCSWSLANATEALLLQHYVKELASYVGFAIFTFDFCDDQRHFAVDVPQRARHYPPLLDAIFALSARHLSRINNDFDPFAADRYYQRCLEALIPEIGHVGNDHMEDLLTATVILRLLEELDVPLAGTDTHHHSIGTRALLRSQTSHLLCSTGLRRSASWAGLRQEIYVSVSMQQPPAVKASSELLGYLDPKSDDCALAAYAVSHCLDVLDFCFGDGSATVTVYSDLMEANLQWGRDRPLSYDPLSFPGHNEVAKADNPFWEVQLNAPWHVMGWLYKTLALLLLITHDPKLPRIGIGYRVHLNKTNDDARAAIKLICSIAQSNPGTPMAMIIVAMAALIGGDLIEDTQERTAVLEMLRQLENDHGWPTGDLQRTLDTAWQGSNS